MVPFNILLFGTTVVVESRYSSCTWFCFVVIGVGVVEVVVVVVVVVVGAGVVVVVVVVVVLVVVDGVVEVEVEEGIVLDKCAGFSVVVDDVKKLRLSVVCDRISDSAPNIDTVTDGEWCDVSTSIWLCIRPLWIGSISLYVPNVVNSVVVVVMASYKKKL